MEESPSLIPITEAETVSSSPVCVAVMGDIALFQHGRVGLFLLDLRQAMRSVIVRELNASLGEKTIQALLVPVPLECSAQEACILTAHLPELEKLGIQIRSFGPQSFLIEGVPHQFSDLDLQKFILDIVHEDLFAAQKTAREERNKRVAHLYVGTMRALRSPISPQTALGVYQRWITHGSPEFAPDGQPCSTHLTVSALQELIAHGPSKH
jgi:DNA mismatch repair protein MutL